MTILETFIKLRDDLKTWVTNNLNQKANISDVDAKYTKPETGIPESDLSVDVQESLALANTAIQEHQDISGKLDAIAQAADSAKLNGESAEYYLDYDNFINVPTIPSIEGLATELQISELQSAINSKVDVVDGKGLSTNDYTTAEKDKLATIEPDANFYEHPEHTSHASGLYKVTVDDFGHVSNAALVEKEDIVALGIPAQDTTYDEEISDLSDRIDDVESAINTTNEALSDLSEDFEGYKETNNKAVSDNATGIANNKTAIEEIQEDYLKSADKQELQDNINEVSENVAKNAAAIETLNGEGVGSVKQSIDDAFNEFATNVSNDEVVNTYKELINYAATHGPEFTKLVGEVNAISAHIEKIDTTIEGKAASEHTHEIEEVNNLRGLLDELQSSVSTNTENISKKADSEHDHNTLYFTKDEILESITAEDIDAICQQTSDWDGSLASVATEDWVRANYQTKGNYLTSVPDEYATEEFVTNKIAEAQLAGEEVDLSGYAQKSELPTKVSQLQNDSGYLTKVPDNYAKTEDIPTKPEDIGALPADTVIPTVPTNVSAFTNDAGYLTEHQDISGKLDISAFPETLDNESVVKYALQDLTSEQQDQARKNIGIGTANNVVIQPSIAGFIRNDKGTISTSTNYLRTDYLPLTDCQRIEYNVFVVSGSNMATWALFDADKKWLASSGDVLGSAYYAVLQNGSTALHGHMHNTISINNIIEQYPTVTYIVFSTNVSADKQSFNDKSGVDVGWGAMSQYAKFITDDGYGAVRYDIEQGLSAEQKFLVRQNIGINSISANFNNRKYVEEFKTDSNSWDSAFADLIQYCTENNYTACAAGTYELTSPLVIGNVNVDFENSDITNNTTTEACIILTGATQRIHKFGSVTGRQGIGILINCNSAAYAYNKLYARLVRGYVNSLAITPVNYNCWFNEYHILRMRSSNIPLRLYVPDNASIVANESYFYLGIIESYRDILPTKLIELTNTTRCNFYNLSIEQQVSDAVNGAAVEMINCMHVGFFNPRTAEPFNAIQFRFIGNSFYNFVDCEYCKYNVIDTSQLTMSDLHYNIFRGAVVTDNAGSVTNCNTLRAYKDMVVPMMLFHMIREVTSDIEITPDMLLYGSKMGDANMWGIPTLYKWKSGNITINRRFIALLIPTLQIMKTSDAVGNILDEEGNLIVSGADLVLNKLYDINVASQEYAYVVNGEEVGTLHKYLTNIVLSIDPTVNGISSITIEEV